MKLIIQDLIKFRDDRDWKQFHNEETLTMSLGIEAAELMECFQWNNEPELSRIKEEIADVFIYSLLALNEIKWDLKDLVKRKLDRSVEKYPKKKDVNLEDDSLMSIINKFR